MSEDLIDCICDDELMDELSEMEDNEIERLTDKVMEELNND